MTSDSSSRQRQRGSVSAWIFGGFSLVALFFLLTEHRAHVYGLLPYLLPYLLLGSINGQVSYGQWFTTVAKSGPYRFRVWVKLTDRPAEIEFAVSAGAPHDGGR